VPRAFRIRPPAPASTTLLAVFLVVMLALSCGVAFQAYEAARSHRTTAEAVLSDYAGLAATEYARIAREDLSRLFDVVFDEVPRRVRERGMPELREVEWELDDAARAIRCRCPSLREPRFLLVGDLRDGSVLELDGPEADASRAGELVALVRERALETPGERYGLTVLDEILLHAVVADDADRPALVYAILLPQAALAELARDWYTERPLLPPAIAGEADPDSTVRIVVAGGPHEPIRLSEGDLGTGAPRSLDTLETRYGSLRIEASIRPEAADRLVIGGLPSSRVPFALGLLALTLAVGVAGLWEVRRHHNLARLRDDFISSVSHELRTPLTQIRMLAELQVDGKLRTAEERARANRVVAREARRLTHLVENILQFARARATRPAGPARRVELASCIEEVVESFRPLSGADAATIDVRTPPDLEVLGEREAVRRILVNLLDNALKYGPGGQTVRIEGSARDGMVCLAVEDEGPGVPEGAREAIWAPYHRLPRDVDSARPGSGVGLAVVRTLANGLGGRAWVEEATHGGGARFVVELPRAEAGPPSGDGRASVAPRGAAADPSPTPRQGTAGAGGLPAAEGGSALGAHPAR